MEVINIYDEGEQGAIGAIQLDVTLGFRLECFLPFIQLNRRAVELYTHQRQTPSRHRQLEASKAYRGISLYLD